MGMFDDIEVLYALPGVPEDHDRAFQTKSLDCVLGNYRIDADGLLWREDFDIEDQSDPEATGLMRFAGMLARVNRRWVRDSYTGEIEFHDWDVERQLSIAYQAWFRDGVLRDLVLRSES